MGYVPELHCSSANHEKNPLKELEEKYTELLQSWTRISKEFNGKNTTFEKSGQNSTS